MDTHFVKACFDLDCDWQGLPPSYRIYFADELFSEKSFYWTDCYLREVLQIQAPPGIYHMRVEKIGMVPASFSINNHQILHGPARWINYETLEIYQPEPEHEG